MSVNSFKPASRKRLLAGFCVCAVVVLITVGIFASNGWFPRTDPMSGKKTGWFGSELPKGTTSVWNPFAAPPPTPTPQLADLHRQGSIQSTARCVRSIRASFFGVGTRCEGS